MASKLQNKKPRTAVKMASILQNKQTKNCCCNGVKTSIQTRTAVTIASKLQNKQNKNCCYNGVKTSIQIKNCCYNGVKTSKQTNQELPLQWRQKFKTNKPRTAVTMASKFQYKQTKHFLPLPQCFPTKFSTLSILNLITQSIFFFNLISANDSKWIIQRNCRLVQSLQIVQSPLNFSSTGQRSAALCHVSMSIRTSVH